MALKLKVSGITDSAAKSITEIITTSEPDARVDVDLAAQTVTVESKASEETIKQLITAGGYTLAKD